MLFNKVKKVIKSMAETFNSPILGDTGMITVECYDPNLKLVTRRLVKEERTVIMKQYTL